MLPEDDRDLSMARRIGTRLDEHAPLDRAAGGEPSDDASFYRALLTLKQAHQEAAPPPGTAARVWAGLEQQMAQDQPAAAEPRPALRLVRSLSRRTWMAAAASLLLLAALGWLLINRTPSPVLLASADADIITYTAPDGSTVQLRPHSKLYALDEDAARYRLDGEGFFDVTKNEARTFTVEAGDARIAVLGTRFNVSTWGAQTTVFLEEGRIRFEHLPSEQAVELTPGQRSGLMPGGRLAQPTAADSSEYMDWLRQEMNFVSRPLDQVLDELAHHYAIAFAPVPALEADTLTGRILLDRIDQSLNDLGKILDGRFVQIDDETYRFVSN